MNFYIAYGTSSYLQQLQDGIHNGVTLLLQSEDRSVLIHETLEKSSFKEGYSYEVIDGAGTITEGSFAVFNNIPVSDEGRPNFEYRFKNRPRLIEKETGFKAIRVLRPNKSDTYIILTLWESEKDFKNWQESQAYNKAHENRRKRPDKEKVFPRPSYVTFFYKVESEE